MEWTEPDGEGGPDFVVRRIQPYQASKPYRCPGCDQEIPAGTGHVVAWREGDVEGRRHWHRPCWSRRSDRRPRVYRAR